MPAAVLGRLCLFMAFSWEVNGRNFLSAFLKVSGCTVDKCLPIIRIGVQTNLLGFRYILITKESKIFHLSRLMTKPTKWHVRPAKTQISLGIRPV